MQPARTPGQRAGLTRSDVLGAARELLSRGGLDAVTMRGVAQRLAVSPNSLYSHVATKTELIDDVLDDVLGDVHTPDGADPDPAAGLRALMASTYRVLVAHPDLVPLYLARQGAHGVNAHRLGDLMLELLDRGGVTGRAARQALRVLIVYTIGFAAFAIQGLPGLTSDPTPPSSELGENFDSGLRWLLVGIGVAVPTPKPAPRFR